MFQYIKHAAGWAWHFAAGGAVGRHHCACELSQPHLSQSTSTPFAGLFTLSMTAAAEERHLLAALLFSALLCFKHIFLYAAPAFFVYMLRRYCRCRFGCGPWLPCKWHSCSRGTAACTLCVGMRAPCRQPSMPAVRVFLAQASAPRALLCRISSTRLKSCCPLPCRGPQAVPRFAALGAIAAGVLGLSFGPFVAAGQLQQVRTWACFTSKLCPRAGGCPASVARFACSARLA